MAASAAACPWCVDGNAAVTERALALAGLTPAEMLAKVRGDGTCVKILRSGRQVPPSLFHWEQVEAATAKLGDFTKIKGLMGKTVCENEVPLAKGCLTIVLASDAPRITLVHEFLHSEQIKNGRDWCVTSKDAWATGKMSVENYRRLLDREWDVHKWLWEHRAALHLSTEDKVEVAGTLLDQAERRKSYDASAADYCRRQRVATFLDEALVEYKKLLGLDSWGT